MISSVLFIYLQKSSTFKPYWRLYNDIHNSNCFFTLCCLLVSCTQTQQKVPENKVLTDSISESENSTIKENKVIPDISGKYELVEGYGMGPEKEHDYTIYKGALHITKIAEGEFGYTRAIKRHQLSPNGDHGIFSYHDGRFYDKNIDYSNLVVYHSRFTTILVKPNTIATIRYFSNMTEYGIWKKVDQGAKIYISLRKTLKQEQQAYKKFHNEVYNDPKYTKKNEFVKYKSGTAYDVNDSSFFNTWQQYKSE